MRKLKIQHLGYTIFVKRPNKNIPFPMYVERNNRHTSTIYIKQPIKKINQPLLAHEVLHILQNISADYGIDMIYEKNICKRNI